MDTAASPASRVWRGSNIGNIGTTTPSSPKVLFFGDSFVRLFGLIKHSDVRVRGFKGATAKGIGKQDNPNALEISRTLGDRMDSSSSDPLDRVILSFGNVDVHLSYFYKKYGESGETIDLVGIAESYADFAASMMPPTPPGGEGGGGAEIVVIGAYPSPPEDEFLIPSLVSYGTLTEEQASRVDPHDASLTARRERVDTVS